MSRRFVLCASTLIALLTFPVRPADAQPASLNGPVAGFVFSSVSKTVRPLLGIPGATHIEQPILSRVDSASIAPGGNWAFITRRGHSTFVKGLSALAPAEFAIDGLIDAIDRVAWSRDGSFAALYSSSGNQLQRVQFSGSQPSVDTPVNLSAWGQVTTLAIDPAGQQIAVGFPASGLYLFTTGQSPTLLTSMTQPVAAAFDGTGQFLYAIDLDAQQIVQFQSTSGVLKFVSLAQPDGTSLKPAGLAVSGDGRYLLLADSATQSVFVYEISTRSVANTIPLSFVPSSFETLSAGPVVLLNGNDPAEWLLVLDASQVPKVYFVPAGGKERR